MEYRTFTLELAGRPLTIETGKLAKQANGAVLVRYGDTVVLVTATSSAEPREGIDFFPLTVDVEERLYAVGRIPGNWHRREGRPPTKAILAARLTDRPIRPLFPKGFRNDVQIISTILSVDHDHAPEVCSLIGASAALSLSDIPFEGPIGAVIVGRVDGRFIINPKREEAEKSDLHLVVAGTRQAILMVEAGAREIPEESMLEAILYGHEFIKTLTDFQEKIVAEVGKPKRRIPLYEIEEALRERVEERGGAGLREALTIKDKLRREETIDEIEKEVQAALLQEWPDREKDIAAVLKDILKKEVRRMILEEGIRPDGRRTDEIRPISVEVGILPRTHGSGLFTRGQTQVLSVATLGAVGDVQPLDDVGYEEAKATCTITTSPPFSVGEARPLRGAGRREIGHGALAERALEPVLPPETDFPYTVRVVSEVLESNGSTSMASVCGSTLALMDAGVPVKAPVGGVAMGLIEEGGRFAVLTDIQGLEDALGDMDFKVAGTREGVTALQMDIKIGGVNREILSTALKQAREGRLFILDKMTAVLPEPRKELSPYAPRILVTQIDPEKIRDIIGPGGKIINRIISETKTKIDVEQDGRVFIAAADMESGQKALSIIESLTRDPEVGSVYLGKVVRLMNFGAFVEFLPGKEGLVHISQLAEERVGKVEDVVNVGDEILVKVVEIDDRGRINLSHKEALRQEKAKKDNAERPPLPGPKRR
ncbi:MAG: polyribonucleotide nucleotidyltransferase [Firmicutes bacterium]|nr:polyribonucleotide nucleotidyltransferase [Bacillota bacterium]